MTNAEQSWYTNYVSYTWALADIKTCMPQPSRNKKHQTGSHLLPSLYILYYFLNKENLFMTLLEFRYFDYFLFKNNNSMDEKYFFCFFFPHTVQSHKWKCKYWEQVTINHSSWNLKYNAKYNIKKKNKINWNCETAVLILDGDCSAQPQDTQ